jgi:hypothetical protein
MEILKATRLRQVYVVAGIDELNREAKTSGSEGIKAFGVLAITARIVIVKFSSPNRLSKTISK